MKIILHKSTENILIYCKEGIVYKVNKRFVSLTGYLENEVIGKSIDDLSTLLRLDSQIDLKETNNIDNVYMFIKGDNPRKVNISSKYSEEKKERIYLFEEIKNPLLDYILENIFSFDMDDKQSIVVYSIDNYILLKSNRQYIELLSSLNISTENLLGRTPIFPQILLNCNKNINYGHETELSFTNKDDSNSYFDVSTIPLYEDGKEKYLLNIINDVTERVLSRNDLKKQKEKIETILDNVSDKVMVFDNKGDYVYVNKSASEMIDTLSNINLKDNKAVFKESKLTTMEGKRILFDSIPSQRVLKGESFSEYRYIGSGKYNMAYYNVLGIPLYDKRKN